MISPSAIKRVKYTEAQSNDFIRLQEYIIFEDDRDNEKYIVFKFKNCVAQWLHELKFIVSEFDSDNQLIQKITVSYKEAKVKENSSFVPSAKYRANGNTDHISVEIEQALFEKMEFNKGETKELKYDYTDYKNEQKEDTISPSKVGNTKDGYIKPTFELDKDSKKNKKKKINIKNITNSNRSYAMPVFSLILGALVVAISIFLSLYTKEYYTTFYDDKGMMYQIVLTNDGKDSGTVAIVGSMYDPEEISIRSEVTNVANGTKYKVVEISENAFVSKSNLRKVLFESDCTLTIQTGAFDNCNNLGLLMLNMAHITLNTGCVKNCPNCYCSSTNYSTFYSNWKLTVE